MIFAKKQESGLNDSSRPAHTSGRKRGKQTMPVWILICYLIVSVFVIFAIVRLYGRGEKVHAKSALTQYAAYTIIFIALYFFHLSVPSYALLLTMLTVLLSSFCGHYLGYYTRFGTFDRYLHAFGTFSFSLMIYCIINSLLETGGIQILSGAGCLPDR